MESITVSISNDYQQPIKKVDNHSTSSFRDTTSTETIDIDVVAEEDLEMNNIESNKSDSNFFEKVGSGVWTCVAALSALTIATFGIGGAIFYSLP